MKPCFFLLEHLLMLLLLAVPACLLIHLRRGRGSASRLPITLSASAPGPGPFIRGAEALALALMGGTIFIRLATNRSIGGALLELDALQPAWRPVFLGATAAAALLLLVATLLAWRFRAIDGVLLTAATLGLYAGYLNMGPTQKRYIQQDWRNSPEDRELVLRFSRQYDGFEFPYTGADLWVNGVYLGKTPLRMPLGEFHRRVPVWDKPPRDEETGKERLLPGKRGMIYDNRVTRWLGLYIPESNSLRDYKEYFAQLRLAGYWGTGYIFGHNASGSYDRFVHDKNVSFPEIDARLANLINQARLKNYIVDAAWITAMESFGEPVWALLDHLARKEPGLATLVRQRLNLRFGLDQIKTPDQAWSLLESIMADADRTATFDTATSVGQVVALIAPRLAPERLAREACRLIPVCESLVVAWTVTKDGRVEFEMPAIAQRGSRTSASSRHYERMSYYASSPRVQPPRALVLTQAIRYAQAALQSRQPGQPTVFQKEVVPQLLRWQWKNELALKLAAALGGPDLARFFERQDWRAPVNNRAYSPVGLTARIGMVEVNKWAYTLCRLPGEEGWEFRWRHQDLVFDLARRIIQENRFDGSGIWRDDLLDFLFLDPQLGPQSPAVQFWPDYRQIVLGLPSNGVNSHCELLWHYLVRMEPQTSTTLYAEAWRDASPLDAGSNRSDMFRMLQALPAPRRAEILRAVETEIRQQAPAAPQPPASRYRYDDLPRCKDEIQAQLFLAGDPDTIDRRLEELLKRQPAQRRETIMAWLQKQEPGHALIERLAQHPNPELRAMAPGAIATVTTPENRALLPALLTDPDAAVRTAAQATQHELDELARTPARQFALTP